jgi:hypothetical protein
MMNHPISFQVGAESVVAALPEGLDDQGGEDLEDLEDYEDIEQVFQYSAIQFFLISFPSDFSQ